MLTKSTSKHAEIANEWRELICELYDSQKLAADQLPYTIQFDLMFRHVRSVSGVRFNKVVFWRALCYLRKNGKLTRKQKEV